MQHLATQEPSYAQKRRRVAVGFRGQQLGLHLVPGVVLAQFRTHEEGGPWMPEGHHFVQVWTVGDPREAWKAITSAAQDEQMVVVAEVKRPNRWPWSRARWQAWWRWQVRPRAGR